MDENKVPGIWKWSVILLVLCNIGLILTVWLKPQGANRPPRETPREYVIRNLKLNDAQVQQYDVLIAAHQHEMKQFSDQMAAYNKALFGNLAGGGTGVNPDSVAQLIANSQMHVELVTYKHFEEVRKLCNDAQKAQFDKIITDVIKKMNGAMHGMPPRGHDHNGPPQDDGDHPHDDEQGPPQNP